MKQTKHLRSRLLSLLLCCIFLAGLLPAKALAVDASAITTDISVTKQWAGELPDGVSHPLESVISVSLLANGTEVDNICELNANNLWTGTWENMPVNDSDGKPIAYTVRENNSPDNYTPTVTGSAEDGFVITNTYNSVIRFDIPIFKEVKQGGAVAPGPETFTFDAVSYGFGRAARAAVLEPTFTATGSIDTDGAGYYFGTLTITVPTQEDLLALQLSGLLITERNGGKAGWTYDDTQWLVVLGRNNDGSVYGTYYNLSAGELPDPTTGDSAPGHNGLSFTNTYTNTPAQEPTPIWRPQLNKAEHHAFLVGYPDGTFGPDRNMTRAEVTVMFARLLTEPMDPDMAYPNTFTDVPADAWYANYIGFMQRFGLICGYEDNSFRPDEPITRAEFSAIACRFEALSEGRASFTDVPANHWAAQYINFAATRGWVSGYPDGSFLPDAFISRAEVASVTCRLLERSADRAYVTAHYNTLPRTFTDMNQQHWAFWYAMEAANGHDYTRSGSEETWICAYK